MKLQELIGQKFERLTVVSKAGRDKKRNLLLLCKCECGNERIVLGFCLKNGHTKSCGCLRRQLTAGRSTTHGKSGSLEHTSYAKAKYRCTNPNHKHFHNYGGRGIKFLFGDFAEFLDHIGPRPGKEYSLDRINNDGNYEPGNVRWATQETQNRNKRTNHLITYQNKTLCVTDWAEKLGFSPDRISARIRRGWSVEKALSTPVKAGA